MNIEIKKPIDRSIWLRAMNMSEEADDILKVRMEEAEKMLLLSARPKAIYRIMEKKDIKTSGNSVIKHLEGCGKVAVMGATLGSGVDELIRKTQIKDMAMAVIMDFGASVLIEYVCDEFSKYIDDNVDGYTTSRFSPGYGDFPIECQKDVVRYIDGQRKIGLNVTSNSLMIPRKSVTALIGISDRPVKGKLATCSECVLKEKCAIRKEGKFCGD